MKLHANASLSLKARERMVARVIEQVWTLTQAAEAAEVSVQTCSKWVKRARAEGSCGLLDRSSAPHQVANRTCEQTVATIAALRRLRMTGPEIAEVLDRPLSTIGGILTRIGMGKLGRLGMEPAQRYERARPGELIHIDVKKLGRIYGGPGKRITGGGRKRNAYKRARDTDGKDRKLIGWDYVHIAIDDATRMAYAEVLPDEKAATAVAFLRRAIKHFASYGMRVEELITDNGGAYLSTIHAIACRALGIRHLRTRPYRPQTNGKAERFIRTMLSGWAYGAIYASSDERTATLDGWLFHYNHRRRHQALGQQTPATRLNNLLGTYT